MRDVKIIGRYRYSFCDLRVVADNLKITISAMLYMN